MDKIYEIVDHQLVFTIKGKDFSLDLRQMIWPCSALSLFYLLFWKKTGFKDMDEIKKLALQNEDEDDTDAKPYQPQPLNIPAINGWLSVFFRKLQRSAFGRSFLTDTTKQKAELDLFLHIDVPDKPTFYPIVIPEGDTQGNGEPIDLWSLVKPSDKSKKFHFNTISDYVEAYRSGSVTPTDVANNVINALKDMDVLSPRMRIIIESHVEDVLARAAESTERWKANTPLSVFDGIPIAVKDEIFLGGYPCRAGLPIDILGEKKSLIDEGLMVQRLREGGAVFIGMANMHQLGIGVTGINPSKYHGTCRNPYNPDYPPGGSSSGPGAAVAAGLCPVALGADGGGSIRIPSSVNGIVGAKASFGRISATGFHPNCDTVAHPGGLCATTRDAAITYGLFAGKDPKFSVGLVQPPPNLVDFEKKDLDGIVLGIDWNYFNDAAPEIVQACKEGVDYLINHCNAKVVEISIPELQESARAHVITTLTEMHTYGQEIYHKYHDAINTDTEINLGLGGTFSSSEYFMAQKQRTRLMTILKRLYKKVDCIVTPACGDFMPKLTEQNLMYGFSDLQHLTDIIRFSVVGNLAGNPSIAVPVGYSPSTGLPIGILLQTSWWKEDVMFRIAHAMEGACELQKPRVYYDVLKNVDGTSSKENGAESPSQMSPML